MYELEPLTAAETTAWDREMRAAADADEVARWGRVYSAQQGRDRPEGPDYDGFRVIRQGVDIGRLGLSEERGDVGLGALHVDSFWVRPELRGRGVGRQLVQVAESEVRRRRLRALRLAVAGPNQVALHLYRTSGFRTVLENRLVLLDGLHPSRPVRVESRAWPDHSESGRRTMLALDGDHLRVTRLRMRVGDVVVHRQEPGSDVAVMGIERIGTPSDLPLLVAGVGEYLRARLYSSVILTLDPGLAVALPADRFPVHWHHLGKEV